jgi:hypothetical protein
LRLTSRNQDLVDEVPRALGAVADRLKVSQELGVGANNHPSSVPVSREHRRAKTDRLDTELLKRAFLGSCAVVR